MKIVLPILAIITVVLSCTKKNNSTITDVPNLNTGIKTEASKSNLAVGTPKTGFMLNYLTKPSWRNSSFLDSVKKLGLEIIRFPGGTESQYFDWQTGRSISSTNWGPAGLQNHSFIGTVPHVSYPLSELKYFFDQTGVKPIFCLNLLTKDLNNQLLMLRTAKNLGIPVEYIELGNELFFTDSDFVNKYATPNDYVADIRNNWIPTLSSEFPLAKIAVIGSYDFMTDLNGNSVPSRISSWNSIVYSQINTLNAITFHYYMPPNTTILSSPQVSQALAAPFKHWQVLKQNTIANVPNGMDVFVTEYNLADGNQTTYSIASSWTHALYTSSMFFLMLEESKIKMILNHQLTGSPSFASLTSYTPYGDTLTNNLSAEGNAMRLIHNTLINTDSCYKITFSINPLITAASTSYNSIHGFIAVKSGRQRIILLNLSDQIFNVDLRRLSNKNLSYELITSTSMLQKNINTSQLTIKKATTKDNISIPPYSLTSLME